MQNKFTKVTNKGFLSRIASSIGGIFFGIAILFISIGLIFWNEGRTDISKVASTAVQLESNTLADSSLNRQLVSVTGNLTSEEVIGDTYLQVGNYLKVFRNVEMYAWIETKRTENETNVGGSETTTETYSYSTDWTSNPANSNNFQVSEGHTNPSLTVENITRSVNTAQLGEYNLRLDGLTLPTSQPLELSKEITISADGFNFANENYLFNGQGTLSQPEVGDIRISYTVLKSPLENVTAFGSFNSANQSIEPFYDDKNNKLYRVLAGNFDSAINTLRFEHKAKTWALRIGAFFGIWIALMLILSPVSTFLDILPIFGRISRAAIGGITFIAGLLIWLVTLTVSIIAHNIFALIISLLAVSALIVYLVKNLRN
jgi:hypothetical protein